MFRLSMTTPYKGEIKTLKLLRNPFYYGLGHYKDTEDRTWDVNMVVGGQGGKSYVCARQVCGQSYYGTGTYDTTNGFHEWIPYYVEVVGEVKPQLDTSCATQS